MWLSEAKDLVVGLYAKANVMLSTRHIIANQYMVLDIIIIEN